MHWFWRVLIAAGISLFAALTRLFARRSPQDCETCCRNCSYILRGITEPRCLECGERI